MSTEPMTPRKWQCGHFYEMRLSTEAIQALELAQPCITNRL